MKLFISWSGNRSLYIAQAIGDWLPNLNLGIELFFSEDIEKGTRGGQVIARQLESSDFGIACLTPENLSAPWINFEAGALSKKNEDARLWTFLYGLQKREVAGPLKDFQHTSVDIEDVTRLVKSIHRAAGSSTTETRIVTIVEKWWPELEKKLGEVPTPHIPERSVEESILDIGQHVRSSISLNATVENFSNGQQTSEQPLILRGKIQTKPPIGQPVVAICQRNNHWRPQVPVKIDSGGNWEARIWLGAAGKNTVYLVTPNELGQVLMSYYERVNAETKKKLKDDQGMWIPIQMDRLPPGLEIQTKIDIDFLPKT